MGNLCLKAKKKNPGLCQHDLKLKPLVSFKHIEPSTSWPINYVSKLKIKNYKFPKHICRTTRRLLRRNVYNIQSVRSCDLSSLSVAKINRCLSKFKHLSELRLELSSSEQISALKKLPNLSSLDIILQGPAHSHNISFHSTLAHYELESLRYLRQLSTLRIGGLVPDSLLSSLMSTSLSTLIFHESSIFTARGGEILFELLDKNTNLSVLHLPCSYRDFKCTIVGSLQTVGRLKSLSDLSFRIPWYSGDSFLREFAYTLNQLHNLSKLRLHLEEQKEFNPLESKSVHEVALALKNLKALSRVEVYPAPRFVENLISMRHMVQCFEIMRYLKCPCLLSLKNQGFAEDELTKGDETKIMTLQMPSKLTLKLDLYHFAQISSLVSVSKYFKKIKNIHLDSTITCYKRQNPVTILSKTFQHFTSLKSLSLSIVNACYDEDPKDFFKGLRNLTLLTKLSLKLHYQSPICSEDTHILADSLSKLTCLSELTLHLNLQEPSIGFFFQSIARLSQLTSLTFLYFIRLDAGCSSKAILTEYNEDDIKCIVTAIRKLGRLKELSLTLPLLKHNVGRADILLKTVRTHPSLVSFDLRTCKSCWHQVIWEAYRRSSKIFIVNLLRSEYCYYCLGHYLS